MNININLSIVEAARLHTILKQEEAQQEAWIDAIHTTDEERTEARENLAIVRSLLSQFS